MSGKKCCVPGCASTQGLAILHGFPNPEKDKERFNAWLMAIGGDILGLHNNHIHKYRKVCHIHFAAKYHCRNNRISNVAIPTLNIPGPLSIPQFTLSERRPMRSLQNIESSSSKPKVNSLFSLTKMLAALVFHPLYMWIYMSTLNVFPGTVFLISAAFIIPAVAVSLCTCFTDTTQ